MTRVYRDDLEAAHRRIADLERAVAAVEKVETTETPKREERRYNAPLLVVVTITTTFVYYVVVIGLFDGQPPDYLAEEAAAWLGAFVPVLASGRLWWARGGRSSDVCWLVFNALRVALVLIFARGALHVFFWWAPLTSVAILLGEIVAARRNRSARRA
ncbi:MAG: hypothetical protein KIT84_20675 [Labilithrix sp.]|nr:hypothetical protein [Labilithrix sp.]MCW5813456.1 hypothetical protein [Labilithrix sp.]